MDRSGTGTTLATLLADRARRQQHRPLLTFYDDVTGARTELSYATADNWAAKTANLLAEELGVEPGATVALDLDGHWTAAVIALACWRAGAGVRTHGAGPAAVMCCHASRVDAHRSGPLIVVGDGLRAEPLERVDVRDGMVLLGDEVGVYADDFDDAGTEPGSPALLVGDEPIDHTRMLLQAARIHRLVGDGARVGLAGALDTDQGLILLAAVVHAGGSIVASRSPRDGWSWDRWVSERVTAAVGDPDADVAPGGPQTVLSLDEIAIAPRHPA